jgi:hypothetical protein
MHIVREKEQRRASDGKRRTVGKYQVFHDGVAQSGPSMSGTVAESRGPGANKPRGNGKRVEEGRYPLATQDSESETAKPKPGFELTSTGQRAEILVHPGRGFLASVGCINPCTSLPKATELITYAPSRKRVIALIEDMKAFLGSDFPTKNGKKINRAFVVIDGEPSLGT